MSSLTVLELTRVPRIEELMSLADKEELTKSIPLALNHWIHMSHNPDLFLEIISNLISRGTKISEKCGTELLEDIDKMKNLIQNMEGAKTHFRQEIYSLMFFLFVFISICTMIILPCIRFKYER